MADSIMRAREVDVPYTEVVPPADLAVYVDRFWLRTTRHGDPARMHRILPDGCVDVIVHAERGAAELVGTMTCAVEVPESPADLVAIRFRPGAGAAIARAPLAELTDRQVELTDLGITGDALVGHVVEANTTHDRVAALVAWLRERLAGAPAPDPVVGRAVALLSGPDAGAARVDDVADRLGVTRQHLARLFRREVGLTPKELARIARIQRAVAALGRGAGELARLAVELGYFDQSHLANDVRELIGVTPRALAADRPIALSHLFSG
jgi:AraC-like DNA-binding protein